MTCGSITRLLSQRESPVKKKSKKVKIRNESHFQNKTNKNARNWTFAIVARGTMSPKPNSTQERHDLANGTPDRSYR